MSPTSHKGNRRARRRRRWPLDEALRREGLDEVGYAQTFGGFFQQLEGKTSIPKLKLMLDGLKEWGRHLEPKRSASAAADDAPMIVQLVHNVARPPRPETPETSDSDEKPTETQRE